MSKQAQNSAKPKKIEKHDAREPRGSIQRRRTLLSVPLKRFRLAGSLSFLRKVVGSRGELQAEIGALLLVVLEGARKLCCGARSRYRTISNVALSLE